MSDDSDDTEGHLGRAYSDRDLKGDIVPVEHDSDVEDDPESFGSDPT
jgi:hypothetical protein